MTDREAFEAWWYSAPAEPKQAAWEAWQAALASERAKQAEPVAIVDLSGPEPRLAQLAYSLTHGQELYSAPLADDIAWGIDWGRNGDQTAVSIIKKLPDGSIEVVATEYGPPADDEAVRLLRGTLQYVPAGDLWSEIDAYLARVTK